MSINALGGGGVLALSECRRILMPLLQTTFENIMAMEDIAYNDQFFSLSYCFSLIFNNYIFNHSDVNYFVKMFLRSSAVDVGTG